MTLNPISIMGDTIGLVSLGVAAGVGIKTVDMVGKVATSTLTPKKKTGNNKKGKKSVKKTSKKSKSPKLKTNELVVKMPKINLNGL